MKAGKTLPNNAAPGDMGPPRVSQTQLCMKVFVQRDYSDGTTVKFQNLFPPELEGKLDRAAFENTIGQLNAYFREAERGACSTYCEGCMACLTAYLMYICAQTHYEKCLRKVAKFVQEQNERVYKPRGLYLTNPVERGLRVIREYMSRRIAKLVNSIPNEIDKNAIKLITVDKLSFMYKQRSWLVRV